MDTLKFQHGDVKIIAHRGLSGIETENSLAAFIAAGNRSYWGIETDVHVTADGQFAIIHDDNAIRVTGTNAVIEESSMEKLKKLHLYDRGTKNYRSDLKIPTLSEYISICKKYGKAAVLELKNPMSLDNIKDIINLISAQNYLDSTTFISFDWNNLVIIRSLLLTQKAQFLTTKCDDKLIDKLKAYSFGLDILYSEMNPELARKLSDNGIEINCWTVDDMNAADALRDMGINYLTTNIIE